MNLKEWHMKIFLIKQTDIFHIYQKIKEMKQGKLTMLNSDPNIERNGFEIIKNQL